MTWTFLYLAILMVGLVLGAVTGLFRDLFFLGARHRHLVVPNAEQHFPFLSVAAERISVVLMVFGLVGLVVWRPQSADAGHAVAVASAGAAAAGAAALLLLRRRCPPSRLGARVTVVGDIPPGGYGQVVFAQGSDKTVLAAQNLDDQVIPAGAEVVVLDCERSVVSVRRAAPA